MSLLNQLSSVVGDRTQASNRRVAEKVSADPSLLREIAQGLSSPNVKLVGDTVEIFTMTAETRPEAVAPYIPRLAPLLASKDKRVRWETMHTLALVARHAPQPIGRLLPKLAEAIAKDPSVIVRDYAVQALSEYAATGPKAARAAFPHLVRALTAWDGQHAAVALEGLGKAAEAAPALAPKVITLAERYEDHVKSKMRQTARRILRKLRAKP